MNVKSYAKINLGLNVLYKRYDGYHELESIMTLVSLSDDIDFEILDSKEIIITSNIKFLNSSDNTIYKIAHYLQKEFNINQGIRIHLQKNIPVSGGMGGGSSNAATTITTLNDLWNINLSKEKMYEIGLMFGADIPFCLHKSPAVIKGIGEIIEPFNFKSDFDIIVVKMPFGLSTKKVFDNFDPTFASHYPINYVKEALIENNRNNLVKYLSNNLEDISINLKPDIQNVKNILTNNGCFYSIMSGSGPTVLGFIDKNADSTELIKKLEKMKYEVFRTHIMFENE